MNDSTLKKLVEALESGKYNAAPARLRSGCISVVSEKALTAHEMDVLYAMTFGHVGYSPYPPSEESCKALNEQPRTKEQIEQVMRLVSRKQQERS